MPTPVDSAFTISGNNLIVPVGGTVDGRSVSTDGTKLDGIEVDADVTSAHLGTSGSTTCAGNDSRLSNARTPATHAASHITGGSDTIADVVSGGDSGLMNGTDKAKLDGISASSGVAIGGTWAAKQNLGSSTQAWLPLGGPNLSSQPSTAIATSSWVAPKPGTINSIYLKYAGAVTIADNIVFNIYINGTDSGHGCTVASGTTAGNATGLSVSYNAGDLIALGAKQASTAAAANLFITASLAGS